jgi:hypothetical protein
LLQFAAAIPTESITLPLPSANGRDSISSEMGTLSRGGNAVKPKMGA